MFLHIFLIFLFFVSKAQAGVEALSEREFRSLAEELSHRVNLFQEVWEKDPEAEFYGGTTRDYLYWLRGQFKNTNSRAKANAVVAQLRTMPVIDVRDFIIGDSDVDIVSRNSLDLSAAQFGVRKFDHISPNIFDQSTSAGQNELWQGFIPAEKVRLSQRGLSQNKAMGDGVGEIYKGKLSLQFTEPEKFWKTSYAANNENHPVLLALRFLRL